MVTCDARQCPARATRELWLDNGLSLFCCSHHSAEWLPWITPAIRFAPEDVVIMA